MLIRVVLTVAMCLAAATPALAKSYHAERFDSHIVVRDDGSLLVTETLVLTFDTGTFTTAFRTIPTRRTDGIEFVSAAMDGRPFGRGSRPGEVEVGRRNGIRITWHFEPRVGTTHTFEVAYIARGVITQDEGADLLAWRALPTEHQYRIDACTIRVEAPVAPLASPEIAVRRVDGGFQTALDGRSLMLRATSIRRNGWIEPHLRYPRASLVQGAPAWQLRRQRHREMAPTWSAIAGGVIVIGLVMLIGLRLGYDAPPADDRTQWASLIPPDPLPPALAGVLVANGQVRLEHGMAALVGLAERGVVAIREEPRGTFGQRSFTVYRTGRQATLAPHEDLLLEAIFRKTASDGSVSLHRARAQLMHQFKRFRAAINRELKEHGLFDEARHAHRRRYVVLGIGLMLIAAATVAACIRLASQFGQWPLLVPLAIALVAIANFIFGAAETPLSNDGARRADVWRGYQRHLRHPQEIEPHWGAAGSAEARLLPFVIAMGLAATWSKFLKQRRTGAPDWFTAASHLDGNRAFAAFVASGGAGAHSSGGASGGAAGGGASGAG